MRRVEYVQARRLNQKHETVEVDPGAFANLADNLSAAWNAPGVTMRARQQLLRALIINIVVDVDDQAREVVRVIHWHGGASIPNCGYASPGRVSMAAPRQRMPWP